MTDYSSLTVPKLKDECGARGLVKTGNKAELIARLEEADAGGKANGVDSGATEGKQAIQEGDQQNMMSNTAPLAVPPTTTTTTTTATASLHPDPSISATLSTLPPNLQEEYNRRLARATKFGTPLSEVKVPAIEAEKPVKPSASSTAKPVVANGKKPVVAPDATTSASGTPTPTVKPVKEVKVPIQAGPPVDEETLKRRRERFGEVAKDEPKKKVKGDATVAVKNGTAEQKVEEEKTVDPEVAKRLHEEEERKRKRAERFGVTEVPASAATATATTETAS